MRWIALIKQKSSEEVMRYVSSSIIDDMSNDENDIKIESNYAGPHLKDQFNEEDFKKLLSAFHNNNVLHTKYALLIINKAIDHLKKLPNVNEISCTENDQRHQLNIVGDLHGQFM
jgi:hypothetical protein